jgi:hypothetical protein
VVGCIITVPVVLIFKQPILRACSVSGTTLLGLVLLVALGTWLYARSAAGRVLLDCGPHPMRNLFLLNAVVFLILGLLFGLGYIIELIGRPEEASTEAWLGVGWAVLLISFAPYWLGMANGRLQVCENGIWQYWGLVRWSKFVSYRWANDGTLLVRGKGFFSWFQAVREGPLPIPPEHKQAIEGFLAQHCPTAEE